MSTLRPMCAAFSLRVRRKKCAIFHKKSAQIIMPFNDNVTTSFGAACSHRHPITNTPASSEVRRFQSTITQDTAPSTATTSVRHHSSNNRAYTRAQPEQQQHAQTRQTQAHTGDTDVSVLFDRFIGGTGPGRAGFFANNQRRTSEQEQNSKLKQLEIQKMNEIQYWAAVTRFRRHSSSCLSSPITSTAPYAPATPTEATADTNAEMASESNISESPQKAVSSSSKDAPSSELRRILEEMTKERMKSNEFTQLSVPHDILHVTDMNLAKEMVEYIQRKIREDAPGGDPLKYIIGFDTETKPTFEKKEKANPPALIQLAIPDNGPPSAEYLANPSDPNVKAPRVRAYIIYLNRLKDFDGGIDALQPIFSGPDAPLKAGVGSFHDAQDLHRKVNHNVFGTDRYIDTGIVAQRVFRSERSSLNSISCGLLGHKLSKREKRSNWEAYPLHDRMVMYAATDAKAGLLTALAMEKYFPKGDSVFNHYSGPDSAYPVPVPFTTERKGKSSRARKNRRERKKLENKKCGNCPPDIDADTEAGGDKGEMLHPNRGTNKPRSVSTEEKTQKLKSRRIKIKGETMSNRLKRKEGTNKKLIRKSKPKIKSSTK